MQGYLTKEGARVKNWKKRCDGRPHREGMRAWTYISVSLRLCVRVCARVCAREGWSMRDRERAKMEGVHGRQPLKPSPAVQATEWAD